MMNLITHGSFRVAVTEDAEPAFEGVGSVRRDFARAAGEKREARRVTVEYYRSVGGLPQRALLGGRWVQNGGGRLEVEIEHSGRGGDGPGSYMGELAHPLVPGLPEEYVAAVLRALGESELPSGSLKIDCAAHDLVESSELAFRTATLVLAEVLAADESDVVASVQRVVVRLSPPTPTSS